MMMVCVRRSRDEGWHQKQTRFHAPTLHLVIYFKSNAQTCYNNGLPGARLTPAINPRPIHSPRARCL